ncbi:hypothetical protein M0R45_035697 [Rubus argutus]|uniref:Uncharacterized protein n=1 Tax=Rubus argutus TaxID=59490 RepID=A0AAW1VWS3_RUBAR
MVWGDLGGSVLVRRQIKSTVVRDGAGLSGLCDGGGGQVGGVLNGSTRLRLDGSTPAKLQLGSFFMAMAARVAHGVAGWVFGGLGYFALRWVEGL